METCWSFLLALSQAPAYTQDDDYTTQDYEDPQNQSNNEPNEIVSARWRNRDKKAVGSTSHWHRMSKRTHLY